MQRVVPLMDLVLRRGGTIDRLTADGWRSGTRRWTIPSTRSTPAEAANAMMETLAKVNEVVTHERQ